MGLLRRMFGPSREEIWRQLSEEIDATYIDGGFWKGDKVEATQGDWTVTLDTYTVSTGKSAAVFTRMRAPYVNPDGFRFNISRRHFFSGIAKFFGKQDLEIGDEAFDADFIIQANDEFKIKQLLGNSRIRALLASQPRIQFKVVDDEGWLGPDFPEHTDELQFIVGGVVKDTARLKDMYQLFAETLDELCRIGSAYEGSPGVRL